MFELWGRKGVPVFRHQNIQFNASIGALLYCSADLFSTTPGCLRLCVGCLHIQVSSHPPPSHSAGISRGGGGGIPPFATPPLLQKLRGHVSLFRSCTLCVQGSAQKQDVAEPPHRPPSLTFSVHSAREGLAPRAQVFLLWALSCPLLGVPDPLGGTGALPYPLIPWRRHGSHPGEAQSEEAACYSYAVTSLS